MKCDLGSVDNPHDPPCVRCRRESKECYFSATRRKRRTDDGEGSDVDEYIVRNGRKRLQTSGSPPVIIDRRTYSDVPLTPGGSHGRTQPLRRPAGSRSSRDRRDGEFGGDGDANQTLENLEAQTVMRREMYGPHDALDLLYKAATDRCVEVSSWSTMLADPFSPAANDLHRDMKTSSMALPTQPSLQSGISRGVSRSNAAPVKVEQPIDPELSRPDLSAQPAYVEAIKAWQRFRFVRAGWFTAQEAIDYID